MFPSCCLKAICNSRIDLVLQAELVGSEIILVLSPGIKPRK